MSALYDGYLATLFTEAINSLFVIFTSHWGTFVLLKDSLYGLFIGVEHGYPLIIHCLSSIASCNSYMYLGSGLFWHQVQF